MGLFLIKEIRSKSGEVHFRRWRLLSTPWFNIYIHNILKSDADTDAHDHPWNFTSIILKGSYQEYNELGELSPIYKCGSIHSLKTTEFHRLKLIKSATTLAITGKRKHDPWGYMTEGGWVDFKTYRQNKNKRM
jgi:hypothetical protein